MPGLTTCRNEYCRSCGTAKLRRESRTEPRRWYEWRERGDWLRLSVLGVRTPVILCRPPPWKVRSRVGRQPQETLRHDVRRCQGNPALEGPPVHCFPQQMSFLRCPIKTCSSPKALPGSPYTVDRYTSHVNFSHALCTSDCDAYLPCMAQDEPRLKIVCSARFIPSQCHP